MDFEKLTSLAILKLWHKTNQDIDLKDTRMKTVLMHSCEQQKADYFDYILDNNPDVNLHCESGDTAIHFAVKSGNLEFVRKVHTALNLSSLAWQTLILLIIMGILLYIMHVLGGFLILLRFCSKMVRR